MIKSKVNTEYLVLFILFAFYSFASSFVMPVTDDWQYFTSPNFDPHLFQLLPYMGYWRPFDVIYGWFLGFVPEFYPYLNHILVSLNHVVLIWLIFRVSKLLSIERKAAMVAAIYFAITPAIMATLLSVDSLNQSFSMLWGGWAIYAYLKFDGRKRLILYLLFSVLSVFSKESGIVWVFIAPFLYLTTIINDDQKKAIVIKTGIRTIIISIIFVLTYFSLRIFLSPENAQIGSDNPNDRGYLSVFSLFFIKNILMLFGSAVTNIDTISIFVLPYRYSLSAITLLSGIPVLVIILGRIYKKCFYQAKVLSVLLFFILIIVSASPHLILSQIAEMHVYPTVFMIAVFTGWLMNDIKFDKVYLLSFVLFVSGAFFSSARKFDSIYQYGRSGIDIALELKKRTTVKPEKVLIISYGDEFVKGYSVFYQDQRWAYYGGAASRFVYNYRYPVEKMNLSFKNEFEKDSIIKADGSKYNCIWIIYRDSVDVINNY